MGRGLFQEAQRLLMEPLKHMVKADVSAFRFP